MAWGQVPTNEGLSWIRGAGGGNSDPGGIEDREENRISQNPIVELQIEATAMGGVFRIEEAGIFLRSS
jgi:hypothetical protein